MSERTSGIYNLVTIPAIYKLIQNGLGGRSARRAFRDEFFNDVKGLRVLEVGCGPGTWFPEIKECGEYLGMDWNQDHIALANEQYGKENIQFLCGDVSKDVPVDDRKYDYIFAFGILHHLDDQQANALLKTCKSLLSDTGKFLAVDPVYHQGQHFFAKWMCDRDSGQDIRTEDGYKLTAKTVFKKVETQICTDKLRIPYSHCVITAS